MKPLRVGCADHIRRYIPQTAWTPHIGIDPCYKLLPKKQEKLEDLYVAAMGAKLTDAENMIKQVLPEILQEMKTAYGWANIPRVVVHDKASYYGHLSSRAAARGVCRGVTVSRFYQLGGPRSHRLDEVAREEVGRRISA